MARLLLVVLAVLLCTCTRPRPVMPPTPPPPARVLMIIDTSGLSAHDKAVVTAAMASWEVQTHGCVTIREGDGIRVVQMPDDNDYPWWVVGMYVPEAHRIEVKFGYEDPLLVVIHELGHALGMAHVAGKLSVMYKAPHVAFLSAEDRAELFRATGCPLPSI